MLTLLYLLPAALPQWELTTSISYVYDVSYDGNGGLWCASSGGVFSYSATDGVGVVYSCPEDLPLPDCSDILLDSGNRLWIATVGKGVVMKEGDVSTVYTSFEGVPGLGYVNSVEETSDAIWIGCDGGLARGGAPGFVPVKASGVFNTQDVYSMAQRNDTLWLCTDRGVYSLLADTLHSPFSPDSWTYWPETHDMQLERVRVGAHSVYACGPGGAAELQSGGSSFQYILDYSMYPDSAVFDIRETSEGLLAAGRGVVLRKNGSGWLPIGTGLPTGYWATVLFELGDSVFCGYSFSEPGNHQTGLGFYLLQGNEWEHHPIPGMQCKRVHQSASCSDGRLYVGTYARGVQAYYPGFGWRSYVEVDGMPNSSQTFSVAVDPAGGVWASSYHHGLSWIRDNATPESQGDTILTFVKDSLEYHSPQSTIIPVDELPNNQPVMIVSQAGGMWAAFRQFDSMGSPDEPSGILGFNGHPMGVMNWAGRLAGRGLAAPNVRKVYPVSTDSLWIAFEAGAGCQLLVHSSDPADDSEDSWHPGSNTAFTTSYGLPSNDVYCFLYVPGTGLLAGTGEGLALWNGSGFSPYLNISEQVSTMSLDSRGRVWCLSPSGIYRIDGDDVSLFNEVNSDYIPSTLYEREYSTTDAVGGGVFFSSIEGLWLVSQAAGGATSGSDVSFYPQPFLPSEDVLRLCGPDDELPVKVDFFGLDGSYMGAVSAPTVSDWVWTGELNGESLASGLYAVLVTVEDTVYRARIAVVR